MKYDITIYEPPKTNKNLRFTLGTAGAKPLFVIGLNPSTADDKEPDKTIRRVWGYADRNGFDCFVMFNLYAQRTPYPVDLSKTLDTELHLENIDHIKSTIEKYNDISILAAWGGDIEIKKYLKTCLAEIYISTKKHKVKWVKIGDFTKGGHPRHPSRGSYLSFTDFDIEKYLQTLK